MSHHSNLDAKSKIIEAARTIITKLGVNSTSLQAIADEAGISKGSLYYYFKTKNAILYSIVDADFSAPKSIVQRIHKGELSQQQAQDKIISAMKDRLKREADNKLHLYLAQEALLNNQEIKIAYQEKYNEWLADIAEGFRFAFSLPQESDAKILAYLFICLMDGWCMQDLMQTNTISKEEVTAALENLIRGNFIPSLYS